MDISMGKLIGLVKKLGGGQGAGGGGGTQPDWNQNDPNAADYVKGRTHYDASRVLMNKVLEPDDVTDSSGSFVRLSETPFAESDLPNVVLYYGNGNSMSLPMEEFIVEPGLYALSEGICIVYVDNVVAYGMTFPTKGVYVMPITEGLVYIGKLVMTKIETLDPKFLPAGGGTFVVNLTPQTEGNYDTFTADKTFEETIAACKAGQNVIFRFEEITEEYEMLEISKVNSYTYDKSGDTPWGTIDAGLIRFDGEGAVMAMYKYDNDSDGIVYRAEFKYTA